jgi:aminodeoxychorismate lyase
MNSKIYLNGQIIDATLAKISVDDRGFRYGDGLFETIHIHNAHPYLLDYHLARLKEGLRALKISMDTENIRSAALNLLAENSVENGVLRIIISRGEGGSGYLPVENSPPTVAIQTHAIDGSQNRFCNSANIRLRVSEYRQIPLECLPVNYKISQGLGYTLARIDAKEHNCDDALMLTVDNFISETASANIFWIKNSELFTPSLATGALDGVIRRRIIELAPIPVHSGEYRWQNLANADGVFITNTGLGVAGVSSIRSTHEEVTIATDWVEEFQTLLLDDVNKC